MDFSVGTDVESMCTSCGDVWHVIVAKIGKRITKVQCKQCSKQHRFRPTGDAPAVPVAAPTRRRVRGPERAEKAGARVEGLDYDPALPSRPYAIFERFAKGEQIEHKKFGPGVIVRVEDNKIRVNFKREGLKVLLHDRKR